jgi:cobalt-zinc-cadmium efflux system membrane fusion protein
MLMVAIVFTASCDTSGSNDNEEGNDHDNEEVAAHDDRVEEQGEEAHLSELQFESLGMKIDTLGIRNIGEYVDANGLLEVPPQNQASVTAIIGANITRINVIEGDKVKKGQALAYLIHPDLIKLQTDYINSWNQLEYLEKEYARQKKLYEENVGSGKEFQRVKADYLSTKGMVQGFEAQLKLMGLNIDRLKKSELYEEVPVISPIDGYIGDVNVKTGMYVSPQIEMFEVVNNDFIHADLMVFEKDMNKVKIGQKITFSMESLPGEELEATIFAIGKSFEQGPKTLHIHAEIDNKQGLLLPGMYIRGRIMIDNKKGYALPEGAVVRDGNKFFMFAAKMELDNDETKWTFTPIEMIPGIKSDGWVEIKLLQPLPEESLFAWNNAYYLIAQMKKSEAGHGH